MLDWKNPVYTEIFAERRRRLQKIRQDDAWDKAFTYYAENPIDWIEDWLITYDPRRVAEKKPPAMPFIL
ncbi:MAG: hypothetical protein V3U22_03065, partial [Vicinamibacteria bacterium]